MKNQLLTDFAEKIINGPTGFKVWEDRECVIFTDRDLGIAHFVLDCLTNHYSTDAADVLHAIAKIRLEKIDKAVTK